MKEFNKMGNQVTSLSVGLFLVLFYLIAFQGTQANSQTLHEPRTSGKKLEAALEKFEELERLFKETSEKLTRLQGKIKELERRERALQNKNKALSREISRLRRFVESVSALESGGQERKPKLRRVKRSGGRPRKGDAMVSMAAMAAAWTQIDHILDKLDEITTRLSQ